MKPKLPRCTYVVVGPRCCIRWNIGDRVVKQCMTCAPHYKNASHIVFVSIWHLKLFARNWNRDKGALQRTIWKMALHPHVHFEKRNYFRSHRDACCQLQCSMHKLIIHSFIFEIYTFPLRWPSEKWNRTRHLLVYWKRKKALLQIYISETSHY